MRGVRAAHNSAQRNALPNVENDADYLATARRQVRFADFGRKWLTRDHETHLLWEDEAKVAEIHGSYNLTSPWFAVRGKMVVQMNFGEVAS